ncbi:hypothetical protein GQ41_2044 [Arenibacter algicola]|uniref:Uncharacterized protein n=1 Tax=Arenibacter algicola TaxID=616991 RepID=A0ABY3AFE4_9FLAO
MGLSYTYGLWATLLPSLALVFIRIISCLQRSNDLDYPTITQECDF